MSFAKASSLALFFFMGAMQDRGRPERPETLLSLVGKTDVSCILKTWRLKGILVCPHHGHLRACLWVENAYPAGILEIVRRPGATQLVEASFLKGLAALRKAGVTSSHTADSGSGTTLHFAEARVYTFIPPIVPEEFEFPIARPRGPLFQIHYITELDGLGWRTGLADLLTTPVKANLPSCSVAPNIHRCAGRWGSYTPRIGFASHASEVVAAHLLALRAGRVAASPWGRVILSRYDFEPRTGHYIQMIRPVPRPCVAIGTPNVRALEADSLSKEGAYLFLHFGIFEECKRCLPVRFLGPRPPAG